MYVHTYVFIYRNECSDAHMYMYVHVPLADGVMGQFKLRMNFLLTKGSSNIYASPCVCTILKF